MLLHFESVLQGRIHTVQTITNPVTEEHSSRFRFDVLFVTLWKIFAPGKVLIGCTINIPENVPVVYKVKKECCIFCKRHVIVKIFELQLTLDA